MNNVSFTLPSGGLEYLTELLKLTLHISRCIQGVIQLFEFMHSSAKCETFKRSELYVRGGADKPLAHPTSRCRRTESIVSLEIGVC